ncbi:MAG: type II secretion system minor pseudopilin GspI [Pirellulales bacterium]
MKRRPHARRGRLSRRGFTLLEVLLALAILVGSLATLGELVRMGLQNAHRAAASTTAQLLCESKLAEITAGIMPPSSTSAAPLDAEGLWQYAVAVEPTIDASLLVVRVTVAENLPSQQSPVEYSLVRWMVDPEAAAAAEAAAESAASSTSSSAAGTSP